jgi:hypothetical protein
MVDSAGWFDELFGPGDTIESVRAAGRCGCRQGLKRVQFRQRAQRKSRNRNSEVDTGPFSGFATVERREQEVVLKIRANARVAIESPWCADGFPPACLKCSVRPGFVGS